MNDLSQLRKKAEILYANSETSRVENQIANASLEQLQKITHELRVHQIELELQNEELKSTQVELLHAKKQYQELFERAPVGYLILTPHGSILNANDTACTILGASHDKLSQQSIYNYIAATYKPIFANHLRSIIKHKNKRQDEIKICRADGYAFFTLVESSIAHLEHIEPQIRLVMTDIDELYQMRMAAENANKAKSIFLANISHELRTPMHGVLGFAILGAKKVQRNQVEKISEYFDNIRVSAQRLLTLLDDLLDLSKLEAGKMQLKIDKHNILAILHHCKANMEAKLMEQDLQLNIISPLESIMVFCDKLRIEQVIFNLLSNAMKYAPQGSSITFKVELLEQNKIKICVIDEGCGLKPNRQTDIFGIFTQDDSDKICSQMSSSGLGLTISKEIIDLHHEKIWADTHQANQTGGIFCFTLSQKNKLTNR